MSKKNYRRIHVRVPVSCEVSISHPDSNIKVKMINISQGGIAVTAPAQPLPEQIFQIEITTEDDRTLYIEGLLLRQNDDHAAFKTLKISQQDLEYILKLVDEYQSTVDYVHQLDQHNMLQQKYIDDDGRELEVTFETDP